MLTKEELPACPVAATVQVGDRQQVETADYAKFTGSSLAVQRTEKGLGGDQSKGADGQPALHGG